LHPIGFLRVLRSRRRLATAVCVGLYASSYASAFAQLPQDIPLPPKWQAVQDAYDALNRALLDVFDDYLRDHPLSASIESADKTVVAGANGRIVDAAGLVWTLTPSGQIIRGGVTDATVGGITDLYYRNHTVYAFQKGVKMGLWWQWLGTRWSKPIADPTQ
jgi:hypothetical protein